MGFKAKISARKRERERTKQERFKVKHLRQLEAKERKTMQKELRRDTILDEKARELSNNGESDPDLIGIVPGPQPLPEQWSKV